MALAPASTDFILSIQNALVDAGMLNDQVVILDPANQVTTPYDPLTDTGGDTAAVVVLGPRPAYVKALAASVLTEAGLLQGIVRFRVQFLPEPGDPVITKGMIVRVLEGSKNEALPQFAFGVLGQTSGSIAALTKLEVQTNGTPSEPWRAP